MTRRVVHGTTGAYTNSSCRCDECRAAITAWTSNRKKERRLEGVPENVQHGRYTTYCNWSCRCEECTEAWRIYNLELRRRRSSLSQRG
jgi:hypothetical protein